MKIGLLSRDDQLFETLANSGICLPDDWVLISEHPDDLNKQLQQNSFSHLIISDRLFDFGTMEEWVEISKEAAPSTEIILLLSNHHEASINEKYRKMCSAREVDFIPPGRGVSAITEQIRRMIAFEDRASPWKNDTNSGKIITFVGSTPNIGTTVISFAAAYALAASTKDKIGYLCLNLKSSKLHLYLGREEPISTLDRIRAELKAQSLTKERLLRYCDIHREAPNLHILYGNQLREQSEFFAAEEIDCLLRIARASFDLCVVEVNAYWDNAATVCGVLEADSRIVVTTGDLAHFQEDMNRWIRGVGSAFGLEPHSFELIATQIENHNGADQLTVKDIRKETQMPLLGKMMRYPDLLPALNRGKLLEILAASHVLGHDIAPVARILIDRYQLQRKHPQEQKSWFRRVMSRTAAT